MTGKELEEGLKNIREMNHVDMAILVRYAPSGHPYFDSTGPFWKLFKERFESFGGMTVKISKEIGWDR